MRHTTSLLLVTLALVPCALAQYAGVPQHSNTKRTTTTFAPDVIPSDQQAQSFLEQHQNAKPEYQQPKPDYQQPKPDYQQPKPEYQQPKPEYQQPQQNYPNPQDQGPYKDNTVISQGSFASSSITDQGPQQNAGNYWWAQETPFKGAGPASPSQSACGGTQCGGGQPSGISPGNPFLNPQKPPPGPVGVPPGNPFLNPQRPPQGPACGYGGCGDQQTQGLTVACSAPGHICVPKSSCSNGVVNSGVPHVTGGVQKCDVSSQVCCRLPSGGQAPNVRPNPPIRDNRYPVHQGQGSAPGTNGIPIGSSIYDRPVTPAPTYKPYDGPLNVTPHPGCAAALKCVEIQFCTAEGVMSENVNYLTREQEENRVPLSECSNPETGIIGKCCRDPNYKDPWPQGMPMPNMPGMFDQSGFQTGQYFDQSKNNQKPAPFHPQPFPQQPPQVVRQPEYQPPKQNFQPPPQQPYQPPRPQQPQQPIPRPQQPYQPPQNIPRPQEPYQPPQKPYQPPQKPYQPPQNIPRPQEPYQPPQNIPRPQEPYQPPQNIPRPQEPFQPPRPVQPQYNPPQPNIPEQRPYVPQQPERPAVRPPTYPQVQPPRPSPIQPGKCGVKRPVTGSGLGESEAGFGEYPWHVVVMKADTRKPLCSGALISDKAVVTAAHCVQDLDSSDLLIECGVWRLNSGTNPRASQSAPVAALARHPNHDEGTLAHDMAVLLLSVPVQLDEHIDTICLPQGKPQQRDCTATGYGQEALKDNTPGSPLNKIPVNFVPNNVCEQKLKTTNLGKYFVLNQSFQCAVPANPAEDLCKVGAGGPVACDTGNNHHELSALYSWDVGCGNPNNPTALAEVDTNWIQSVLNSPLQDIVQVELNEIDRKRKSQEVVDQESKPGFSQGYGK